MPDDCKRVIPRILLGGTYAHARTGERVDVVDFELSSSPKTRRTGQSARTGRYVIRSTSSPANPPFLADEDDLQPLSTLSTQTTRERTAPVPFDDRTRVRTRPEPVPTAPPIVAQIQVTRSPDPAQVGRVFPVRGEHYTIGRDSDNDLPLNDPDVSRHHARIIFREGQAILIDTESTNGTVVNGSKITETPVRVGDLILMGSSVILFQAP